MSSSASSSSQSPITFTNIMGQGRVNQLGGVFINGRPLPHETRMRIIELAAGGVKPCKISRDLRVSHGAVSKILNRFQETGSISPGQIGGNPRCRLTIQAVEKRIVQLKRHSPTLSAAELRATLIQQGVCSKANAPTASSINRHLRSQSMRRKIEEAPISDVEDTGEELPLRGGGSIADGKGASGLPAASNHPWHAKASYSGSPATPAAQSPTIRVTKRKLPLSHSIDNILNGPSTPVESCIKTDCWADDSVQEGASPSSFDHSNRRDHPNIPNTASSCSEEDGENQIESSEIVETASKRLKQTPHLAEARRNRTSFTAGQLRLLEEAFAENMYPDAAQREQLVKKSELDEDKIITWFSNRRARNRKVFSMNLSTSLQAQRKFSPLALNRLPSHFLPSGYPNLVSPAPSTPVLSLMQPFHLNGSVANNVAATAFLLLNRQLQAGCQLPTAQLKEE